MKSTMMTPVATLFALATLALADGDNCIHLTGDKTYTWSAGGDFQGSGQIDNSTHCFGAGSGRISFGSPNAPQKNTPGNTLLECHFPTSETDADFYNCNLSLIDGWSAAVTCVTNTGGWPNSPDPKSPLGSPYDLKPHCSGDLWDEKNGLCKNNKGAKTSGLSNQDAPFVMAGTTSKENPNPAEVYFDMQGAYKFSKSQFPLTCTVGAGQPAKPASSKREEHVHEHAAGHAHHVRAVRARSLEEMVTRK